MLAEAELKDPIGWKWRESYDPPPPPTPPRQPAANNNNNANRNQTPQFRRENPKPVRTNIRL
jgi:hypothetical protein